MVLACDKALVGTNFAYRLVMTTMSVFQLIYAGACSLTQELISHADTHAGLYYIAIEELANVLYSSLTGIGVTGTIGKKQTVKFHVVEIIIPGNTDNLYPTVYQASENVGLDATVHQNHLLGCTFIVSDNLLA